MSSSGGPSQKVYLTNASGTQLAYGAPDADGYMEPQTLGGNALQQVEPGKWVEIRPNGFLLFYGEGEPHPPQPSSSGASRGVGSYLYVPCESEPTSSASLGSVASASSESGPTSSASLGSVTSASSEGGSGSAGPCPEPDLEKGFQRNAQIPTYAVPYVGAPVNVDAGEGHTGQPDVCAIDDAGPGKSSYSAHGFKTAMDRATEIAGRLAHGFVLLDRVCGNNLGRVDASCQVNVTAGNMVLSLKLPSAVTDPPLRLNYNSRGASRTELGFGWSSVFSSGVSDTPGPPIPGGGGRFLYKIQSPAGPVWTVYRMAVDGPALMVIGSSQVGGRTTRFDVSGENLSQIVDEDGRTTGFLHDPGGDLRRIDLPDGASWIELNYDNDHHLRTWTNQPDNETTTFTYVCGLLASIETPPESNATTSFFYPAQDQRIVVDAEGNRTTLTLDIGGNVAEVMQSPDPALPEVHTYYAWDSLQRVRSFKDGNGNVTTFTYAVLNDRSSRLSTIEEPTGTTQFVWPSGKRVPSAVVDQNGNRTSFSWDSANPYDRVGMQDAEGAPWAYGYVDGQLSELTDPLGKSVQWIYRSGRRVAVEDELGNRTSYTYDGYSQLRGVRNPLDQLTTYTHDAMGRLLTVTDANGNTTSYTYDGSGRQILRKNALGYPWQSIYRLDGALEAEIDPNTNRTDYEYDAVLNRTAVVSPDGRRTEYEYDRLFRNTVVVDPLGNRTTHAYDPAGNEVAVTNPLGQTTSSTFDAGNRRVAVTDPLDETTSYAYDPAGNLVVTTNPLGLKTTQTYDRVLRPRSTIDPLGHATTSTYDDANRKVAVTNAEGETTTTTYDDAGRAIETIDPLWETMLRTHCIASAERL